LIPLSRDKIFIILTDSKNRFNGPFTLPSPLGERDGVKGTQLIVIIINAFVSKMILPRICCWKEG